MLEMCSISHAHDIAKRKGIDLKDIRFSFGPNGDVHVQVDAPTATPRQIEELGNLVQEECPVARFRKAMNGNNPSKKMEWKQLSSK